MDKDVSNIFLHFLNRDTQEIFGIKDTQDMYSMLCLQKGLNAAILLCNEYCFLPLGFYFECSNTRNLILNNLPYMDAGYLRLSFRETEIGEYIEKKQGQLIKFSKDIVYQGFYDKTNIKQIEQLNRSHLGRRIKIGEYCVNRWIEQHTLFREEEIGDFADIYSLIRNLEDKLKISLGIQDVAKRARDGAFVWKLVVEQQKKMNISDKTFYQRLRILFEKYYYEAYLIEYNASILYDFYCIDTGCDFNLKQEYNSIANYNWFENFLRCLELEKCLDLSAEKIIKLKNLPAFIRLMELYAEVCNKDEFGGDLRSLRSVISALIMENKSVIEDMVKAVLKVVEEPEVQRRSLEMPKQKEKIDVLIMIATDEEEKAILQNDEEWKKGERKSSKGYTYFVKTEGMTFALARASEMGEVSSSTMGQYLIDELSPTYLAMAGFCAGQAGKTVLGDVIVPDKIYQYESGKQVSEDITYPEINAFHIQPVWKQKVERFGDKWREKISVSKPMDYFLERYNFMNVLLKNKTAFSPSEKWSAESMPDLSKIIEEFKNLNYITIKGGKIKLTKEGRDALENEKVEKYWSGYQETVPTTKVGVLATGNKVQQWSGVFDELSKKYDRKTIALDMEAHAVASIAEFNSLPYIIAKGVGDYAQEDKKFSNRYIEYSCYAAYRFIIEFFNGLEK